MKKIEIGKDELGFFVDIPDKHETFEGLNRSSCIKRLKNVAKKYPQTEIEVAEGTTNVAEIEDLMKAAGIGLHK